MRLTLSREFVCAADDYASDSAEAVIEIILNP